MAKSENIKTVENSSQKSFSKGLTARQIINRHIQVKNDIITDDDIRNVRIDSSLTKDEAHQPLVISADTERPKDADKDNKIITPWDIINE